MGCLKGDTVAGLVVPTPAYVRFATHYGFWPGFRQGADPESKGLAENPVGYVKSDLMVPGEPSVADLAPGERRWARPGATRSTPWIIRRSVPFPPSGWSKNSRSWGRCCRCGPASASWSAPGRPPQLRAFRLGPLLGAHCPHRPPSRAPWPKTAQVLITLGEIIAEHDLVAPGETSILDEHYGGPRPMPARAVRPKTAAEKAFCALGPAAEAFIKGAAARGDHVAQGRSGRAGADRSGAWPRGPPGCPQTGRLLWTFRAHDVRSIIAAGTGVPRPAAPGEARSSSGLSSRRVR